MNIEKTIENGHFTVKVSGRLDTSTAPELEAALSEHIDEADDLVFDLDGLDYMSSSGLRLLLSCEKKMSAKNGMKVRNVNDVIMEIFEVTGFSDILTIE